MASEKKSEFLYYQEILRGGVINNQQVAVKMAELVVESLYSNDEAERQKPFQARDLGDRWLVEGSHNKDKKIEGHGPVKMWIRKRDAKVIDFFLPEIMKISPEARDVLKDVLKKKE